MKKFIALSLATTLAGLSVTAFAGPGWRHHADADTTAWARVVRVEPITRPVRVAVPERLCYRQPVRATVYSHRSDGAALVGGIVGGILGHNLGHGRGGATLAGTLVGVAVGRTLGHDNGSRDYESVSYAQRCEVRTRYRIREQLVGYAVTYRYHGALYTTRMHEQPGRFVRVRVAISAYDR